MPLSTALSARITQYLRDRGIRKRQKARGALRSSRPLLEFLEDRALLSTDLVLNTNDSGAGSLRTAIDGASSGDTVAFASDVTGIITLTSGVLTITQNLDIEGPGAGSLTISGDEASSVFVVNSGVSATIAELTIADGYSGSLLGGGIDNNGSLTVTNCTFSDNTGGFGAGAIENAGNLYVSNSTFTNNDVTFAGLLGGGIDNEGSLAVTNSTFSGNSAPEGGGIYNNGTLTVTGSTLSGNSATSVGGGIYNLSLSALGAPDSTQAGNSVVADGGGFGGGMNLDNTIVAVNTAPAGPDVFGTVTSGGYNLIGDSSGGSGFVATDLLNVNPLLGPFQNNGGPTQTLSLLPGSPAIAAGSVALIPPGIATDQRGYERIVNGSVDIGAFESRGFIIAVKRGNNQEALVKTSFAAPLVVTVSSAYGEPVQGGVVKLTAPASGASATFAGGSRIAAIDASGQASIAVAANGVAGGYTVTASAGGNAVASFGLKNTLGAPTQLVIHTQPSSTVTAGQEFPTQPVIYEEDQHGNLEAGDNSTQVTVSLASGSGPLQGTLMVTVSGGIATFTNLADNTAGNISLLFTSVPALASAISNIATIRPAAANQLVIHTEPSVTATTGKPFAAQPVIYEEDQYFNLETGDDSSQVTASLRTGTGPLLGTTTVTVAGGIATFSGLADSKAETIVLLFSSPALAKATSNPITISSVSGHAQIVGGLAQVKVRETSRAKSRHAIRGGSLAATPRPHARVAATRRPHQLTTVSTGEALSLQAVPTGNRARAAVRADKSPARVAAELKNRLLAYLIAESHLSNFLTGH